MELPMPPPFLPPLPPRPPFEIFTEDNRATVRQYGIIADKYIRKIVAGPVFLTGEFAGFYNWRSADGRITGTTFEDNIIEWTEDKHVDRFDPSYPPIKQQGRFHPGIRVVEVPRANSKYKAQSRYAN